VLGYPEDISYDKKKREGKTEKEKPGLHRLGKHTIEVLLSIEALARQSDPRLWFYN